MKGPGSGERNWEVRFAGLVWPHPCRHCGAEIGPDETYFIEPAHPWIAVHSECIQMLAWSLRQHVGEIEKAAETSSSDETIDSLLAVTGFLEGAERWCGHVKESREFLDRLLRAKLREEGLDPDPPPKPVVKGRKRQGNLRRPGDG